MHWQVPDWLGVRYLLYEVVGILEREGIYRGGKVEVGGEVDAVADGVAVAAACDELGGWVGEGFGVGHVWDGNTLNLELGGLMI